MYQPPAFKETRTEVLQQLVRHHPLAMLACNGEGVPIVNHVPMIWAGDQEAPRLLAHVARANDLIKQVEDGQEALAIFQGPTHYISPNWYPGKELHGKEVPTYNYMVVHLHGTLHFHEDADWVLNQLNQLTNQMESGRAAPGRSAMRQTSLQRVSSKAFMGSSFAYPKWWENGKSAKTAPRSINKVWLKACAPKAMTRRCTWQTSSAQSNSQG